MKKEPPFALVPLFAGEGRGEGPLQEIPRMRVRRESPHPDRKGDPTSARKRGEVTEAPIELKTTIR